MVLRYFFYGNGNERACHAAAFFSCELKQTTRLSFEKK